MNGVRAKAGKAVRTLRLWRQARAHIRKARGEGKTDAPILIVMQAQMGDVVMGLGVLPALRERHRNAPLLFCCQPAWQELAQNDPLLDGTLGAESLWEVRALAPCFGTVYVLDVPIPTLLGYLDGVPNIYRYVPPTTADWFVQGAHLIDLYAQNAGLPAGSISPRVSVSDAPTLPEHDGPTVVLHTHSSMAAKNWPVSRFAELVRRHPSVRFVVVGAAGEGGELGLLPNVLNLTGQLTLPQTAATIAAGAVFVGPDSGPAYMAWAVGVKSVTLLGATVPETSGPRGPGAFHVRAPGACVPACHRACVRVPLCIDSLTVDAVCAVLERALLLSGLGKKAP